MGRLMRADVVLRRAAVHTLGAAQPLARSVAVGGGRILAVSLDDDLDDLIGPSTRVLDFPDRAGVPGFVDAHIHFGQFAVGRRRVNLDTAATLEDGLAMLRMAARRLESPTAWLLGRGWDRNRWGRLPTRSDLDAAVGIRPAALSSHDGHSV